MRGYGVLHRRTLFSLWRRWSGLLDSAQIRAAYPCRAGPDMLSVNDNDTKFKDETNQRWAKESSVGFHFWSILILNSVQILFPVSNFLPAGGAHPSVQTTLVPSQGSWEGHRGPVITLSYTLVTVSLKGTPPWNTAKISIRLSPEFENPELGKQFIFFLTSSFYKK